MFNKLRFLILFSSSCSLFNYVYASNIASGGFTHIYLYQDDQGKKHLVPNPDKQEFDIIPEEIIQGYELVINNCKLCHPDIDIAQLEKAVECYRKSTPISQVDVKVAQAFEIIKKDLGVPSEIELRVLPSGVYTLSSENDVAGLFDPCNPNVVYIVDKTLQKQPIFIIQNMVHELEHFRQFWHFPGSFERSLENQQKLGKEEFNRRMEYEADKKAAEYFKCFKTINILSSCSRYSFQNPLGYFTSWDYWPYWFKNFFSSSKGFSGLLKKSDDVLDYLPNSGVCWCQSNIAFIGIWAIAAALIISSEKRDQSKNYYK